VRRAAALLTELKVPTVGLLENMRRGDGEAIRTLAEDVGMPYLGAIAFDPELETALGDVDLLRKTTVYAALSRLGESL
jgi:Mrp family chromosome partitioning ATPase